MVCKNLREDYSFLFVILWYECPYSLLNCTIQLTWVGFVAIEEASLIAPILSLLNPYGF